MFVWFLFSGICDPSMIRSVVASNPHEASLDWFSANSPLPKAEQGDGKPGGNHCFVLTIYFPHCFELHIILLSLHTLDTSLPHLLIDLYHFPPHLQVTASQSTNPRPSPYSHLGRFGYHPLHHSPPSVATSFPPI